MFQGKGGNQPLSQLGGVSDCTLCDVNNTRVGVTDRAMEVRSCTRHIAVVTPCTAAD